MPPKPARQYPRRLQIGMPSLPSNEKIEKIRLRVAGYGHRAQ